MRRMILPVDRDSPKNAIASMVDIAFLLLIFFLVATTIRPTEQDLSMKLPAPGESTAVMGDPVLVTLEQDGSVRWGEGAGAMMVVSPGDEGEMKGLREMLRISVEVWGEESPGVILKVDDGVDQQRFIDVIDSFALCGIENVGLID